MNRTLFLRRSLTRCAALVILASLPLPAARADDKAAPGAGAPDMEEMMKKMETLATPGPEHRALASMAGQWDTEARTWMAGPDAPPMVSKGACTSKMILGGRFLQDELSGEMAGKKFNGRGLFGYDKFNQKFVNVWIDDMGTGIFTSEGTADSSGKVITLMGRMDDPMTGEKQKPVKMITRILSPDKHVFEMHDLALGEKSKVMEITYIRKSGPAPARE